MKTRIIKNQQEFDKIKRVEADEEIIFKADEIEINCRLEVFGILQLCGKIKSSWNNQYIVARGNSTPHIVARENSTPHIVARENSTPHIEARENSTPHIEAWENSTPHIEAWENSTPHIEARENSTPHIEAWGNSTPHIVARENSTPHIIVARENSTPHIEAWENSVIHGIYLNINTSLNLFGFSIGIIPFDLKIKIKKSKQAIIQRVKPQSWFKRNNIAKKEEVILYKRVSKDFKTQENTPNETSWIVSSIVEHPNWNPKNDECGEGKFHACSRPYFCNAFRSNINDRYIAIQINQGDLFEWKDNPSYPHKIGFRRGLVLFECDQYGNKIEAKP